MSPSRFTYSGSSIIEEQVQSLLAEVSDRAQRLGCRSIADGLLLIGGYGRGEGGVERTIEGERLHNNLDLLLLTRLSPRCDRVRDFVDSFEEELAQLRASHGIGIDLGIANWSHLSRTRGSLMGYDARHGHRVLVGPKNLLTEMSPYSAQQIDPTSIEDLVVNRGTLLIINRLALSECDTVSADSDLGRTLIRHAMKAVIGYGDAWLFHRGMYDWSYVEKLRRMTRLAHVAPHLARRYIEAATFRLTPDYQALPDVLDKEANRQLMQELSRSHSEFGNQPWSPRGACWTGELRSRLRRESRVNWYRPRQTLGTLARMVRHLRDSRTSRMDSRWRAAGIGPRRWLRLAFPYVAYGLGTTHEREALAVLLGTNAKAAHDQRAMDEAYLSLWSRYGDANFRHLIAKHANHLAGVAT